MILILAGLPTLLGAIAVLVGADRVLTGFRFSGGVDIVAEVGSGVLPIAIGIVLLLLARGIARHARLAYLLGLVGSIGFAALSLWFISTLIPHLNDGGEFNFTPVAIMFAAVATVVSLGYAALLIGARATFRGPMTQVDRRLAISLAAVVLLGGGLSVAMRYLQDQAVEGASTSAAQAEELVAGTTLDVRVIDATVDAASTPAVVQHLTLEITIRSGTAYQVDRAPVLCLTDLATFRDGGKAGVLCFGAADPGLALDGWLKNLKVTPEGIAVQVSLDRGSETCTYAVGAWSAAVLLHLNGSDETLWSHAAFDVQQSAQGSAPAPGGSVQEPAGCTGISK
ncbi:MAG: hypothetical protein QOI92_2906 [Chloroflexota bacterium]|jgi:hypothetical protein|nr:hypothetical protein [Chloroflexota bacterium]